MDSGAISLGIIILIFGIIAIIANINSKKKSKKLLQPLFDLAKEHHCNITQQSHWNNSTIGIDEAKGAIFFVRKAGEVEISRYILLADCQSCKLMNKSRNVKTNEGNYLAIDKLGLIFTGNDKSKEEITLEFYNADYDSLSLKGELQMAEKWNKIANEKIDSLK
jgi:hypothetical protein